MRVHNLKDNIYSIGVEDPDLRIFDIVMETAKGTTYNSYLINDEKVAVIDICKNGFYDDYKNNIKSIIGDKKIDYIVVQHTELDHSGSIKLLLDDYPEAKVISTSIAAKFLREIINEDFNSMDLPEELSLGKTTLKFIKAPNLHWPDTMFTYDVESKVAFTCDFSGCHCCPKCKTEECANVENTEDMKYYFDCIMSPFKPYVLKGIKILKDLNPDIVAPSHGYIHYGKNIEHVLDLYTEWASEGKVNEKSIPVFYVSAYGNTKNVAKYIANSLNDKGYESEAFDLNEIDLAEAVKMIEESKGFMVGSPTINNDAVKPVWDLLSLVNPIINRGKKTMAFGSYGWSGEAVKMLADRMKSLKLKTVDEGFKFAFVPSHDDYKRLDEIIEGFVNL